jgi:hypothetical protein
MDGMLCCGRWEIGQKKWGKASKPIDGWMGRMVSSAQKAPNLNFIK